MSKSEYRPIKNNCQKKLFYINKMKKKKKKYNFFYIYTN